MAQNTSHTPRRVCQCCQDPFKPKHKEQRFCSRTCAQHKDGEPAWYADARKFRERGLTHREIARQLGKSTYAVAWSLNENGMREKQKANIDRQRQRQIEQQNLEKRANIKRSGSPGGGASGCYQEHHVFRVPRQILDHEAIPIAAKLFAAGRISRRELMARITVRE